MRRLLIFLPGISCDGHQKFRSIPGISRNRRASSYPFMLGSPIRSAQCRGEICCTSSSAVGPSCATAASCPKNRQIPRCLRSVDAVINNEDFAISGIMAAEDSGILFTRGKLSSMSTSRNNGSRTVNSLPLPSLRCGLRYAPLQLHQSLCDAQPDPESSVRPIKGRSRPERTSRTIAVATPVRCRFHCHEPLSTLLHHERSPQQRSRRRLAYTSPHYSKVRNDLFQPHGVCHHLNWVRRKGQR